MSESETAQEMVPHKTRTSGRPARPWLATGLVAVLGVSTIVLVRSFGDRMPLTVLIGLAVLAFLGLLTIVGYFFGLLHFGRLPQQRAFFESVIDGLDEACLVTDKRGRVIFANGVYRDMLDEGGHSRLIGLENLYAGFPDLADKIYRLSQAGRAGEGLQEEFRLAEGSAAVGAQKDKPVWVRVSVKPFGAALGRAYTLWRYRDVSDTRAEQEAAFSHLQYIINYLDHAPAGFFSTRSDGSIAYLNATLASWLGLELTDTTDGNLKLSDFTAKDCTRLLLDVKPVPGQAHTGVFDIDLKTSEGRVLPVRIIHRADFDETGVAQPSRSLVLDMRRLEKDSSASSANARFARLMNNAPFGMAELDREGRIINSNAAFAKLSNVGARGALLSDLIVGKNQAPLADGLRAATLGEAGYANISVTFRGDDENTANIVLARLDVKETESSTPSNVFAYVVDTSKHSSLEEQLAQSQKMQAVGQLAGGVAHDFNNVLTAIIGFSDLLLAKHRPTDPSFSDIMNIKQNANRAANLVRQLLAFSRRQTLRPEVLSLSDIMSDLGNLLGRLLGETVELEVIYGRDLGLVKVDVNQFEQVVINLAVNARDAMDMKGALTLRTYNLSVEQSRDVAPDIMPEGEYVVCEVADTGSGMPPEVIAKIYEPFFSTKDIGKGTGLGLSTVYGIVKQTGGFIFCDSVVGEGTTFKIYLPRVYEDPEAIEVEEVKPIDVKSADMTGDATILLVEDEDAVRAFASRALATRGFTVLEAESGEAALELIKGREDEFDLVLSDVVMPEMDGPSMLKEMRARGIMTRFIFISGYAEDAFEKNLEGEEDFAFLPKPFSLKQLTEAVKNALGSSTK